MSTSSSVIFIDTSSRGLPVYAANCTAVDYGCGHFGFVLRLAAQIGNLGDFPEKFHFEIPVVISERGYSARSSAGFVAIDRGFPTFGYQLMVGKMEFEGGLHVLGHPEGIVFLAPGASLEKIPSHRNSNPGTADAARIAMKVRAQARKSIVISEGQSDYVRGWEFVQPDPEDAPELWQIDFPSEHREEKFLPERLVRSCFNFHKRCMQNMKKETNLAWLIGIYAEEEWSWKKLLAKTEETPPNNEGNSSHDSSIEEEFVEVE